MRSIPYGKQTLDETDIQAVVEVLQGDWLTTGPYVQQFETAFAASTQAKEAVAVNSGTAALHAAIAALDIQAGDEVLVPALTFAATANCVVYQGATPVFVDLDPDTLLIDLVDLQNKITPRTKAVIVVDYAGQPCDYAELKALCREYKLFLVADACHSLGAFYQEQSVGSLADLSCFSFHPVKNITTGEGGMVTTNNPDWARKMRQFRNHGITSDQRQRQQNNAHAYEMVTLGYNYRLTDFQCALGLNQLNKLPAFTAQRQAQAAVYQEAFENLPWLSPLALLPNRTHAYHLYVVRLALETLTTDRDTLFQQLRAQGVGVNVHYPVVYLHPFYRTHFHTQPGLCPQAEKVYSEILTLPLFVQMSSADQTYVIDCLKQTLQTHAR